MKSIVITVLAASLLVVLVAAYPQRFGHDGALEQQRPPQEGAENQRPVGPPSSDEDSNGESFGFVLNWSIFNSGILLERPDKRPGHGQRPPQDQNQRPPQGQRPPHDHEQGPPHGQRPPHGHRPTLPPQEDSTTLEPEDSTTAEPENSTTLAPEENTTL